MTADGDDRSVDGVAEVATAAIGLGWYRFRLRKELAIASTFGRQSAAGRAEVWP